MTPSPASRPRPSRSKQEPQYWRKRLFKGRYAYKGKQFEARNWSVKIQHLGRRKTFSLRSSRQSQAAAEACELYRALVTAGWREATRQGLRRRAQTNPWSGDPVPLPADRFNADYWAQRLIHREYTMSPGPGESQELSVRVDHGGTGHYFPLATNDHNVAGSLALRIYQTIVSHGWEVANKRFSRELTVAFHWLDVPLAWTYTTIHTLNTASEAPPIESLKKASNAFMVAIAESDTGIRRALEWSINQMDGLYCVAAFTSAEEALRDLRRWPIQLVLVSHNLSDRSGTACLETMKATAPDVAGLLYSVYEDSEELFRRTPGGAGTYLLRRTGPTEFLEPIRAWLKQGSLPGEQMASAAWQYFKDSVISMPVGGPARHLGSLTQREHEVLGLLSKGHPDKEIADQLGISVYTVHEHVRNIFDKLDAHNRTEAAVKFLQK
jgi:DNA-binding NarL/FixJ family response regulator